MPRVTHTALQMLSSTPTLQPTAGSATVVSTAADATNKEQVAYTGREVIIFRNSGAGARTVTIDGGICSHGRSGSITAYSIAAAGIAVFDVSDPLWNTSGFVTFEASHAEVFVQVVKKQ